MVKKQTMKESIAVQKTYDFVLAIIDLHKALKKAREYEISRQLLRSATSIGANLEEARAAISKKDFISKVSIASKEARETMYWLRILNDSKLIDYDYALLLFKIEELVKLTTATVKTAQKNLNSQL